MDELLRHIIIKKHWTVIYQIYSFREPLFSPVSGTAKAFFTGGRSPVPLNHWPCSPVSPRLQGFAGSSSARFVVGVLLAPATLPERPPLLAATSAAAFPWAACSCANARRLSSSFCSRSSNAVLKVATPSCSRISVTCL